MKLQVKRTYELEFLVSLCSFGLIMALRSTKTHNVTLENLTLFRPKLCDSYNTNQVANFVNYYCYGVNMKEFSIRSNITSIDRPEITFSRDLSSKP